MPKKQVIVKETAVVAPPARAAKPKTPRVKAAKHSKAASTETVIAHMEIHMDHNMDIQTDSHEAIAQMAYGYWEARGFQHGGDLEDWVRAEHEYRNRKAKPKH
jgi:isopropylmalate/homocitrate/citramalate synthase